MTVLGNLRLTLLPGFLTWLLPENKTNSALAKEMFPDYDSIELFRSNIPNKDFGRQYPLSIVRNPKHPKLCIKQYVTPYDGYTRYHNHIYFIDQSGLYQKVVGFYNVQESEWVRVPDINEFRSFVSKLKE